MGNRLRTVNKLTMDTIAQQLSVSKTTVSRAISGKGRIGQKTRDRILKHIESLDYKPNAFASALAGSKTYNIGVVIPDSNEKGAAPFFKDCLVGIMQASAKCDYDTVLAIVSNDNNANLERLVENKKVDGVVVTRSYKNNVVVSYLQKNNVPFILIGRGDDNVFQIDSDQKDGCCELTKALLKNNPSGIALMAGPKDMDVEQIRYEGYLQAFAAAGCKVDKNLVFWNSENSIKISLDKTLNCGVKCIICSDDLICIKLMDILKERNIKVPQQIKVASFFDSERLENYEVPITALHIDAKALSQKAAELLIDFLEKKEVENRNVEKCSIVYRNSSL